MKVWLQDQTQANQRLKDQEFGVGRQNFSCEPCTEPSKHELNHSPSTSKPSKRPRQTKGRASGLQLLVSHCPSLLDRPNPRNTYERVSKWRTGGPPTQQKMSGSLRCLGKPTPKRGDSTNKAYEFLYENVRHLVAYHSGFPTEPNDCQAKPRRPPWNSQKMNNYLLLGCACWHGWAMGAWAAAQNNTPSLMFASCAACILPSTALVAEIGRPEHSD